MRGPECIQLPRRSWNGILAEKPTGWTGSHPQTVRFYDIEKGVPPGGVLEECLVWKRAIEVFLNCLLVCGFGSK